MSIIVLLLTLLLSWFAVVPSTQPLATDPNREEITADIDAIHAQLESYYFRNGDYPTENEIYLDYDTTLAGLDVKHLTDPNGRIIGNASAYQYIPSGCSALGCTGYVLRGDLGGGEAYEKNSLN